MRHPFTRNALWAYPVFAAFGGSFGYWLNGVEQRQMKHLADRRNSLLEKRARRAEREAAAAGENGDKAEQSGILASTS